MAPVDQEAAKVPTLEDALKTPVRDEIPPELVAQVLGAWPFVNISGVINARDLSQPEAAAGSTTPLIHKGFIYRSGVLSSIEDEGKAKVASDLGVKTVFDLRLASERKEKPSPSIQGVETRWLEPAQEPDPLNIPDFAGEDGGLSGILKMYQNILVTHVPIYREVFQHIRDHPDKPFLYHCNGGKDRAGILSALILRLAGYSKPVISREYALTRIGAEPGRDTFLKEFASPKIADNPVAMRGVEGICSVTEENMSSFLDQLQEQFPGENSAEEYLKQKLGFSEADIEKIRANLRGLSN